MRTFPERIQAETYDVFRAYDGPWPTPKTDTPPEAEQQPAIGIASPADTSQGIPAALTVMERTQPQSTTPVESSTSLSEWVQERRRAFGAVLMARWQGARVQWQRLRQLSDMTRNPNGSGQNGFNVFYQTSDLSDGGQATERPGAPITVPLAVVLEDAAERADTGPVRVPIITPVPLVDVFQSGAQESEDEALTPSLADQEEGVAREFANIQYVDGIFAPGVDLGQLSRRHRMSIVSEYTDRMAWLAFQQTPESDAYNRARDEMRRLFVRGELQLHIGPELAGRLVELDQFSHGQEQYYAGRMEGVSEGTSLEWERARAKSHYYISLQVKDLIREIVASAETAAAAYERELVGIRDTALWTDSVMSIPTLHQLGKIRDEFICMADELVAADPQSAERLLDEVYAMLLEEHDPDLVQAAQVPELVERYRERPVPMGIRQSVRREGVVFGFVEGRAEADYVAETSQLSLLDLVQGEFSRQMDGHDLSDLEARADAYIGLRSQFGHEVVTAASASVELWPAGSEGSRLIGALYRLRVEKLVGKGTDAGAAAVEVRQGLVRGFGAATIDAANLEAAEALVAV